MCNKENLPQRVKKATAATLFARVLHYDEYGRVTNVALPGSDGKSYRVHLQRNKSKIHVSCYCVTNGDNCPSRVVCYHAMAAIQIAAAHAKQRVTWCANEQNARRLLNLGGFGLVCVVHNDDKMFGVVKDAN